MPEMMLIILIVFSLGVFIANIDHNITAFTFLVLIGTGLMWYIKADRPEYILENSYPLTIQTTVDGNQFVGCIIDDSTIINVTKETGRAVINTETMVYNKYVSKGINDGIKWTKATEYKLEKAVSP